MTSYGYDGASRLTSLSHDLAGTSDDQSWAFAYNPAGQIVTETLSNPAFGWTLKDGALGGADFADYYTDNGLNQLESAGALAIDPEARANTTDVGSDDYAYDHRNRLTGKGTSLDLSYDPAGRFFEEDGTSVTRFVYSGGEVIAERDASSGLVLRRYARGSGADDALVWYEGNSTSDRRFLLTDVRGSVVGVANSSGALTAVNKYDEYGTPAPANQGRLQFTGQMSVPEAGLYHYKARTYNAALGRFMQPDPIGYGGGMNMYAYVGNDPVNGRDPSGLMPADEILVQQGRNHGWVGNGPRGMSINFGNGGGGSFEGGGGPIDEIVVTGHRRDSPKISPSKIVIPISLTYVIHDPRDASPGGVNCASAPTHAPTYEELNFDPNGPGQRRVAFSVGYGIDVPAVFLARNKAYAAAEENFPFMLHNAPGDAFRHAYFSYLVTQQRGAHTAKVFGDAHEISFQNPTGERLADLYNNSVGRQLAEQYGQELDGETAITQALAMGCLRSKSY